MTEECSLAAVRHFKLHYNRNSELFVGLCKSLNFKDFPGQWMEQILEKLQMIVAVRQ